MSESRFTAPQAGVYHVATAREPEEWKDLPRSEAVAIGELVGEPVGAGEETCEVHDTPMTDGVCSSCLADSAHSDWSGGDGE